MKLCSVSIKSEHPVNNALLTKINFARNDAPFQSNWMIPFYEAIQKNFLNKMTQEWEQYTDLDLEVDGFKYKATFWGSK